MTVLRAESQSEASYSILELDGRKEGADHTQLSGGSRCWGDEKRRL
jgi:hypothetical protein